MWAGTPAMLIKGVPAFPQSLQPNARVVPRLGDDRVLPNPFRFIILVSSCISMVYGLATDNSVFILSTPATCTVHHILYLFNLFIRRTVVNPNYDPPPFGYYTEPLVTIALFLLGRNTFFSAVFSGLVRDTKYQRPAQKGLK
jgi:hypothetical protein